MYPYISMIMISGCIYFFAEYFTRSFKVLSNLVYILGFFCYRSSLGSETTLWVQIYTLTGIEFF